MDSRIPLASGKLDTVSQGKGITMDRADLAAHREFLKDNLRLTINFARTEQNRGVAPPPIEKPPRPDQQVVALPGKAAFKAFAGTDLLDSVLEFFSFERGPLGSAPIAATHLAVAESGAATLVGAASARLLSGRPAPARWATMSFWIAGIFIA